MKYSHLCCRVKSYEKTNDNKTSTQRQYQSKKKKKYKTDLRNSGAIIVLKDSQFTPTSCSIQSIRRLKSF